MPAIPKLEKHNFPVRKFESPVDAFIFINPDTNEEYTIIGAGVILDIPLEGPNTYASVAASLGSPAKAFGFIPTTRVHRFDVGDDFVPDYVVKYNNPLANLVGVYEIGAMRLNG